MFPKVKDKLPPLDDEIVCYCSGYGCEESTELARKLMEEGVPGRLRLYWWMAGVDGSGTSNRSQ